MATRSPTSPSQALDFKLSGSSHAVVQFPADICYGSVSLGGFAVSAMTKCAVLYASQHPKMSKQLDVRSSSANFFKPIFPALGAVTMQILELNVGKAVSTIRVELFQKDKSKVCVTADILITNFSFQGISLPTHWQLWPPANPVDLEKLASNIDPGWTCWHLAFSPGHFQRVFAFAKYFVPIQERSECNYVEQWISPGWDCTAAGSRDSNLPEARWTNGMLDFAGDLITPIQQNFWPMESSDELPTASIAAIRKNGIAQQKARDAGHSNWRETASVSDGKIIDSTAMNTSLVMSIEIKKKLPDEGVRWLYLRGSIKCLQNGRMDQEVLILDEEMDLVAIVNQVMQLVQVETREHAKASL